jgi:hypothetical protein
MKHLASVASVVLIFGGTLLAQQTSDIHQQTTPPSNARFEIVQSELAAKWTFRLDRFTGHVAQLVHTKDNDNTWEDMRIIGLEPVRPSTQARFQLFTSGIAAQHTFMIDTDTGNTWVLVSGKRKQDDGTEYEVSVWQAFVK